MLHRGSVELAIIFPVCYLGILLGDIIIFSAGWKLGPAIKNNKVLKVSRRRVKKIRIGLERRSLLMIFLARHLFHLRTITFLTCGAVKMNPRKFILADALAALISAPLMLALGYFFSGQLENLLAFFNSARTLSAILLAIIAITLAVIVWLKNRMAANEDLEGGVLPDPEKTSKR